MSVAINAGNDSDTYYSRRSHLETFFNITEQVQVNVMNEHQLCLSYVDTRTLMYILIAVKAAKMEVLQTTVLVL